MICKAVLVKKGFYGNVFTSDWWCVPNKRISVWEEGLGEARLQTVGHLTLTDTTFTFIQIIVVFSQSTTNNNMYIIKIQNG